MAEAASTPQVRALNAIIWSYFDRLAAGDAAKAAAVLSNFQGLYSSVSGPIRSTAAASGFSLPASLSATGAWNADTKLVAQVVMASAVEPGVDTDAYIGALEVMPDASSGLGSWYGTLQAAAPAAGLVTNVRTLVNGASVSSLTAKLTDFFAGYTQGEAAPTVQFSYDPFNFKKKAPASAAVTQLADELLVTGSAPRSQMSLWGWVAVGTGVVVAGSIFAWKLLKKPAKGRR